MSDTLREEGQKMRSDFEETVGKAKDVGAEKLQKVKDYAGEKLHRIGETATDYYHQGLEKAKGWEHGMESYIREKPISSILIAAGVGVFLGFLWTRR